MKFLIEKNLFMPRSILSLIFVCLFCLNSSAQVSTNGGSGLSLSYSTLSEAISALNAATITAPVIITLQGNETAPSGGYVITAQGTMANPITINGNQKALFGSSANVAGSFTDAVLRLVGADYVIIQNFIIMENPAALNETPSTNTVTEWGIALLGASTSNGA